MSHDYPTPMVKFYENPADLVPVLEELRRQGKIIVFGNGCFELLHVGHVRYLFGAKAKGDVLVVAVNTDGSMKKIKPDRNPVNPDRERFELIAAIEAVDYVVPLSEETPVSLIRMLRPHIHTKGTDYTVERIPERQVVESYGGRVEIVGDPKNHSTTSMLRGIQEGERD
jgi:D-beta-D-heptose 7-phosphate kinase/D-beta-D-heptose 1-phosphate adenosyltransferase